MTTEQIEAATAALKKLGGTYLTRHAVTIAKTALQATSDEAAELAVRCLVGNTSVGARNAEMWARTARNAAQISVPAPEPGRYPCCGALTFGDHRDNVATGECSERALRQALNYLGRPQVEA